MLERKGKTLRPADFRVQQSDRPGWVRGTTRLPALGEDVFCAAGLGTLTALCGKTGDGSRLLQIGFPEQARHPFFAAASNVLLRPNGTETPEEAIAEAPVAEPPPVPSLESWLGGPAPERRCG